MDAALAGMDATAQAELVRRGEVTPEELVEAAIERVEGVNPKLNAVIHPLFEEGRAAARNSLPDGPFKGVPFLFKDIGAALAGQPLHLGMRALKEVDFRAPVDTYLAQRFRATGLVTIGKTNTPELGILPTTEPDAYGPTHNPWNLGHSAGGSSGGAAAAVAAGMVPIAHANDGGGSIRIPASACGLVGLKPSRQRITDGPIAGDPSGLTCELIVSRSVRDTAYVLDAVHGPAPGDPYVAPPPRRPYAEELEADPGRLRIGYATHSLAGLEVDPVVAAATEETARLLESLGHEVEAASPEGFEGMGLVEAFMDRWASGQASALALLSRVLGRELGEADVEPLTWALAVQGRAVTAPRYLEAISRHQTMARLIALWYEGGFDLLLTPTVGEPPPPLGTYDDSGPDPLRAFERAKLTGAFAGAYNVTGQPAISLPLNWTEDGLPVGSQFIAPLGREDLLIRIAAQLERAQPWADRTPPVFAGDH